jgi:hypothetical protein
LEPLQNIIVTLPHCTTDVKLPCCCLLMPGWLAPRSLQDLVPVLGISGRSSGGDGGGGGGVGGAFDLAELMEFVGKAFGHSNADVRAAAVRLTREVHDAVGPALR